MTIRCILVAAPLLAALAGCATLPAAPAAQPAGTLVPLGQPVTVGTLVATPEAVVEDSRCPENARCIQAGKLVVSTRIDGPHWRETVPLTLGERHVTHGAHITLVAGVPERRAGQDSEPGEYRFAYEGGE